MQNNNNGEGLSKEALFDSLGHPMRIRILEAVNDAPLSFSEIKRKVGIESSGHLTFHLDKLQGLVKVNGNGDYALSDDGKEALRLVSVFNAMKKERAETLNRDWKKNSNAIWACTLIAIVAISSLSISAMYNASLTIKDDQGKYNTWTQLWINVDTARVNINEAIAAVNMNDFCESRSKLAIAEVYLDLIVYRSSGIIALGEDYSKLYNEGLYNIYLLKPMMSRIGESMGNSSLTDGQLAFLLSLSSALQYLNNDMQHESNGPYAINDVDANVDRFEAIANMIC